MANIHFTVDTDPMAKTMEGINGNVAVVGTAIAGMEAAVIASERKAAKKICASIDSGFYMLMRSRLSQKIAQFTSIMSSRAGSIMETGDAIAHTHRQMQGDFNRIKARYIKLFDTLDRSLEQRIHELDRPAMELADVRASLLAMRWCKEAPAVLYHAVDSSAVALKSSTARTKTRAEESIVRLGEGARRIESFARSTQAVFERGRREQAVAFVPTVYVEAESWAVPNSYDFVVQPSTVLVPEVQANVARTVRQEEHDLGTAHGQELGAIRGSFASKVSAAQMDDRVAKTMFDLFDADFRGGVQ